MNFGRLIRKIPVLAAVTSLTGAFAWADSIGLTVLQTVTTNLNGAGVTIAQAEAGLPVWEVSPSATGQPANLFTYFSSNGTSAFFPNSLGSESSHADSVGNYFYGIPGGVATNVSRVDNYEADYFVDLVVSARVPIRAAVVNQSFISDSDSVTLMEEDPVYDDYAAQFNTLFISGAGNGGAVNAPATCYNGIGVAAYGGSSSVGPTSDNGRAKPDLTAPAGATSFSTPLVAGAAAILLQAALQGDGGNPISSATNSRTIKALLLNGAVKPVDWSNPAPSPLDPRYGSGVLNVFNSYEQLAGGKHPFTAANQVSAGGPHPPTGASGTVSALSGWDYNAISSSSTMDGVNHYYFNVTNGGAGATFTITATLVWNMPFGSTRLNDLDLFLYQATSGALMAASTSAVDNVEHLYLTNLASGRYDLQVLKNGPPAKSVSSSETYALAFEFFNVSPSISQTGASMIVTWPVYPDGFVLEVTPTVAPSPSWSAITSAPVITNQLNTFVPDTSSAAQFFRLRRP